LLCSEDNRNLLIHFLNAVLIQDLSVPITQVEILTPYNDKEFLDDKLSVVDVKARDDQERIYQVETQLQMYSNLPARIIYNWADIYSQQLQSGNDFHMLMPTYSIWLMAEDIVKEDDRYAREYKLRDESQQVLIEHGGIWILELNKFREQKIENERQRWLRFFKEGDKLDEQTLLAWMNTNVMRQAMGTLKSFSDKERNYPAYQARQNFLREQNTIRWEFEQAQEQERQQKQEAVLETQAAMQREEAEQREKEAERQKKEAALQEIERLKRLLGKS